MFGFVVRRIGNERGSVSILMSLIMVVLMALMAYVIDIGLIYAEGIKLSNALDSATLAGAMALPKDPEEAVAIANQYLLDNGVNPSRASVVVGENDLSLSIEADKDVPHYFAKVFGINDSNIVRLSKVQLGSAKSVKGGIRPFAVESQDFQYGDLITLKQGAGDGNQGNYGYVALGGTGA